MNSIEEDSSKIKSSARNYFDWCFIKYSCSDHECLLVNVINLSCGRLRNEVTHFIVSSTTLFSDEEVSSKIKFCGNKYKKFGNSV